MSILNAVAVTTNENKKVWNACLYVRLSREDGDKEESYSITNQKALINEYAKMRPELRICSERVDDGFSGADFNRPSFNDMMNDIRKGIINCVIVKDLSRFGRNWIEAGKYIEQIFPHIGVRFIAINDDYDSLNVKTSSDNISIPFKNLINDAYCRDISIKTKSQLAVKCRKGDFIGSFAVYGYMKDSKNHNKLVIDDFASNIVRDIFRWRIEGLSNQKIANRLNDKGVLSPYEYKRANANSQRFSIAFKTRIKAEWSAVAITRILTNEVYLGVLEQCKDGSKSHKIKKRIKKQKSEWIRFENAHEPIVSQEDWSLVSGLLKHDVRVAPDNEVVYTFSGLIKCADCGCNMIRKSVPSGGKKYIYYVCSTSKQNKTCSPHSISENVLEKAVFESIKHHIDNIIEMERILKFIETLPLKQIDVQKIDKQISAKKQELEKYQIRKAKLYEDFQDKIIDEEEYVSYKADYTKLYNEAEQALFKLNGEIDDIVSNRTDKHKWITHFKEYKNIDDLSRVIVVNLIDKIKIFKNNNIEIQFKYKYDFDRAVSFIETVDKITELHSYDLISRITETHNYNSIKGEEVNG